MGQLARLIIHVITRAKICIVELGFSLYFYIDRFHKAHLEPKFGNNEHMTSYISYSTQHRNGTAFVHSRYLTSTGFFTKLGSQALFTLFESPFEVL